MKIRFFVTAVAACLIASSASAEWAFGLLPGKDKGRAIPQVEYDLAKINSFNTLLKNWKTLTPADKLGVRACKPDYKIEVIDEFPAGKQKVFPKKGQTLVYAMASARSHPSRPEGQHVTAKSTTITVIDADTFEVVAQNELPIQFHGGIHDTILTPDGRHLIAAGPIRTDYEAFSDESKAAEVTAKLAMITGSTVSDEGGGGNSMGAEFYALTGSIGKNLSTMLKIDALTLEVVAITTAPGTLHHGSPVGRYHPKPNLMWVDTFNQDADGAHFMFFDPNSFEVECAVALDSIGPAKTMSHLFPNAKGTEYTVQIPPYEPYVGAEYVGSGDPFYLPPIYLMVFDPINYQWVREIPTPPMVGGFTMTDQNGKYLYSTSPGTDVLIKQDYKTGNQIWKSRTGIGPYGLQLTKDHSEVWVSDKGEGVSYYGRTITVIDDFTGRMKAIIPTPGYGNDHTTLSPNGKEMWITSNAWGQIYIMDVETKKLLKTVDAYGRGSNHSVVWVNYEDGKTPRVIQDSHDYIERTTALEKPFRTFYKVNRITNGSEAAVRAVDPREKGRILFQALDGCSLCHGLNGEGMIGPDIRGKNISNVMGAIATKKDMIGWQQGRQMTDEELTLIADWLSTK